MYLAEGTRKTFIEDRKGDSEYRKATKSFTLVHTQKFWQKRAFAERELH